MQKPHPPIWIGGHSAPAIRRAARFGDGWHPVGANPAVPLRAPELKASLDELFRQTTAAGRDPSKLTISYKAPVYDTTQVTLDGKERRPFMGSVDQIVDDIATWKKLGVSELIFDFRSESLGETLARLEHSRRREARGRQRGAVDAEPHVSRAVTNYGDADFSLYCGARSPSRWALEGAGPARGRIAQSRAASTTATATSPTDR